MAIRVGGKLVAGGKGADGKSAYQQAVEGGYTGTEEEFNAILASGPWLPTSGGTIATKKPFVIQNSNGEFTIKIEENPEAPEYLNISLTSVDSSISIMLSDVLDISGPPINVSSIHSHSVPRFDSELTNKKYVDESIASAIDNSWSASY